ncbi:MAG: OsmC family protein [Desulfobacterales bacterium]|nr:OsmC family protein [Desulfobacterales bacterium]
MSATVKVEVRQIAATASEAQARGHKLVTDRPEAKGGEDRGPMGGEMLLMGLGGCFMSNLLAAVKARAFEVQDLRLVIAGTLGEAPARFTAVTMAVSGRGAAPAELEKLVKIAERGCIVANTLKNTVDLTITVA